MLGMIVVILQAQAGKLRGVPDEQGRHSVAGITERVSVAALYTLPTATGVFEAQTSRPAIVKAVKRLRVEPPVMQGLFEEDERVAIGIEALKAGQPCSRAA